MKYLFRWASVFRSAEEVWHLSSRGSSSHREYWVGNISRELVQVYQITTPSALDPSFPICAAEGEAEGTEEEGAGDAEEEAGASG